MQELREQRAHSERMLAADQAWKTSEREARAKDARDAERRFWLGLGGLLLATVIGQAISGCIQYNLLEQKSGYAVPPPAK
jgi:hypothetical protein